MSTEEEMEWPSKGPNCPECRKPTEPTKYRDRNLLLRAWKCTDCGFMILHPLDANFMLKLKKEKEFEVKVGALGKTQIIRIPALLRDYYHIEKGKKVLIEPKSSTEFTVKVSAD
ncbi:MAG: hypothetical protein QMC85_05670 [Methanocellales archaeon]|nr:hypothetical protein [Methanocellales archaeon]MDI6902658.1 hypothetical protein [Methanocellales archaeon]